MSADPQAAQNASTNKVESAAKELIAQILEQFERAAQGQLLTQSMNVVLAHHFASPT